MSTDPMFRMTVAEVFAITGLGTVAAGQIDQGTINVGDRVWVHGGNDGPVKTAIAFIQVGAKGAKTAGAGQLVGLVLRGLALERVQVGNVVSASEF